MTFNKFRSLRLLALLAALGATGSIAQAQDGLCGAHSVDDLMQASMGPHNADLIDGVVFGVPIPDATASAELFRVDNKIGLLIESATIPRMEFNLDRLAPADSLDFRGAGFAIELDDIAYLSGCQDSTDFPQYYGPGFWVSDDGQKVPATMRLFLWLGTSAQDGSVGFNAVGVMRSEILNGKVFISNQ